MNHTTKTFSRQMSFRDAGYATCTEGSQRRPLVKRVMAWTYVFAAIVLVYAVMFQEAPK